MDIMVLWRVMPLMEVGVGGGVHAHVNLLSDKEALQSIADNA